MTSKHKFDSLTSQGGLVTIYRISTFKLIETQELGVYGVIHRFEDLRSPKRILTVVNINLTEGYDDTIRQA
jgi:hypothetical protein